MAQKAVHVSQAITKAFESKGKASLKSLAAEVYSNSAWAEAVLEKGLNAVLARLVALSQANVLED